MDLKKIKIFPEKFNTIIELGDTQDTLSRSNLIPIVDNNTFMESLAFIQFVPLNKTKKSRPIEKKMLIFKSNFFDFLSFFNFNSNSVQKSREDNLSIRYVNDSFKSNNNEFSRAENSFVTNEVLRQNGNIESLFLPKGSKNFENSPVKNDVYNDLSKAANCEKVFITGSGAKVLNSIPEELKKYLHFNFLTLTFRGGDFKIPTKSQIQYVSSDKLRGRFKDQLSSSMVSNILSHKWIIPSMRSTHFEHIHFIQKVPHRTLSLFFPKVTNSECQSSSLIHDIQRVKMENPAYYFEKSEMPVFIPFGNKNFNPPKNDPNLNFYSRFNAEKLKIVAKNINSLSSISKFIFLHNKESILKTSDRSIDHIKLKKDGIKKSESNIKPELLPNIEESKIHSNFLNEMYAFLIKKYFNFPSTRIHTDSIANNLAKSLNADAFTFGEDIFFASGKFNLSDPNSIALLGHELTHVQQQKTAGGLLKKSDMDTLKYNSLENQATENENAISQFFNLPLISRNLLQQQKLFHPFHNQVVASPTTLDRMVSFESKPQLTFSAIPQLKPVSSSISEMPSFSNHEEFVNSEAKKEQISEIISPEINIDEIAEKVFLILKRKLTIDRERRGKWVV